MISREYRSDTIVKNDGMAALLEKLGMVDAERFISLVIREPFDYTKWRENLFEDMSVEELANKANMYSEKK